MCFTEAKSAIPTNVDLKSGCLGGAVIRVGRNIWRITPSELWVERTGMHRAQPVMREKIAVPLPLSGRSERRVQCGAAAVDKCAPLR